MASIVGSERVGGAPANGAPVALPQEDALTTQLLGASRGDPLTRHLFEAIERRYGLVGRIDTELRGWQRYLVALTTFHPSQARWKERFWKSALAFRLRSDNSRSGRACIDRPYDAVVQIHALFQTRGAPYVAYVDNTHHQSVEGWPSWNPLTARGLEHWYDLERATYRQALHLFTMGASVAESLVTFYGVAENRVTNVGGGANCAMLPTLGMATREPVLLFVGHDFYRKGGDVLIKAFRRVRERMPAARLRIVGTSAVPEEPGVEVLGRVDDRRRVARLYAQARVFCLPSRFDPYPLVLMEAMAYGLPCVSTTVCGIPEIVVHGQTGLLVPPDDDASLATALLHLLEQPSYAAQLGTAGRLRVEQHLNWDRVVDRMAPTLDQLSMRRECHPRTFTESGRHSIRDGMTRMGTTTGR